MDSSGRFVARHVATLPKSGIRDFFAIVSKMKDAVSLGIGEPDFVTPYHIREAAIASLEKGRTSYTDNRGTQQFREEISRYVAKNYGPEYDPETEILGTIPRQAPIEFRQLGREVRCDPGGFILERGDEPYRFSYGSANDLCVVKVAKPVLSERLRNPDRFCALVFNGREGMGSLFTTMAQEIQRTVNRGWRQFFLQPIFQLGKNVVGR